MMKLIEIKISGYPLEDLIYVISEKVGKARGTTILRFKCYLERVGEKKI